MPFKLFQWLHATALLVIAVVLSACGGGGQTPVTDLRGSLRALPSSFTSAKAVNYSPYRTASSVAGLDAEQITEANVKQDLSLLVAAGIGVIRLFDSSEKVANTTLKVIRDNSLPLKVQLGIYIQSGADTYSQDQKARGIALASIYSDIVQAVSVGNETMVYWTTNYIKPAVMAAHIAEVRRQITQPITTDDNWAFFTDTTTAKVVIDQIDFVSMHTYAMVDAHYELWDWRQRSVTASDRAAAMMDAAMASTKSDYNKVRASLDSLGLTKMPITIGETGWKAVDSSGQDWYKFLAHPVNQKMFYDRLATWADASRGGSGPQAVFWFEAFDEPWKGTDDKWGLFTTARKARYVIQSSCSTCTPDSGTYTASNAIYFTPPVVGTAVTASRYKLFSETSVTGEASPPTTGSGAASWNAWEATAIGSDDTTTASEGVHSARILPVPASWGWGIFYGSIDDVSQNLSNFATSGSLHFSVKTTYPGKVEVGIRTGTSDAGSVDAYIPISNGEYGYCNTGVWCDVSIPISTLTKGNGGDASLIYNFFVIADRFANTGKATGTTGLPVIYVDNIYWSR